MTNSIEVINLSKSYGSKEAVKKINFKVNENEIIGRGENFPSFVKVNSLILNLIKKSQK